MNEIKRILKAFKYSRDGFIAAWRSEAAFRWEVIIFVIGTVVALCLPIGFLSRILLISAMMLIVLMELVNTAIESVVDRIGAEIHPLSKKAKDIGSLLVLLSFINALIAWGVVIWNYFL